MGLLDSLQSTIGGDGLLAGLPSSWSAQAPNPQPALDEQRFLREIAQDPAEGFGVAMAPDPFGPSPGPAIPAAPGASGFGAGAKPATMPFAGAFPALPVQSQQPASAPASPQAAPGSRIGRAPSAAAAGPMDLTPQNDQPAQDQSPPPGATNFLGLQPYRISNALQSIARGGSLLGAIKGDYDDKVSQQAQAQNLTAKALLAKGVDPQAVAAATAPGNGDLLKTLIAQAYGPQPVQSLGNGYIYNPATGQTQRAFPPGAQPLGRAHAPRKPSPGQSASRGGVAATRGP